VADPVSWLQIEQGWNVVTADGVLVGAIYPGEVTLTLSSADAGSFEPFRAPPPETTFRPGKPSLSARISGWLRGSR
jgi:hypothetical protein